MISGKAPFLSFPHRPLFPFPTPLSPPPVIPRCHACYPVTRFRPVTNSHSYRTLSIRQLYIKSSDNCSHRLRNEVCISTRNSCISSSSSSKTLAFPDYVKGQAAIIDYNALQERRLSCILCMCTCMYMYVCLFICLCNVYCLLNC